MCSGNKKISLGFTDELFEPGIHICLLYRDEAERQLMISKYLESGILDNEKIGYFTDIMQPKELVDWLAKMGIKISQNNTNQIVITTAKDTYYPTGKFAVNTMLDKLCHYYDTAVGEGFTGARVTGETSWLVNNIPGTEHFLEYEAMINKKIVKHPVTVVCQYDVNLFNGSMLFDILQVHPLMIVHGQIVQNPAYIKPDEFLAQLHKRK